MLPKQTTGHYVLSSSPHTHAKISVSALMLDVIIALLPATACSIWFFGLKAAFLIGTCVQAGERMQHPEKVDIYYYLDDLEI